MERPGRAYPKSPGKLARDSVGFLFTKWSAPIDSVALSLVIPAYNEEALLPGLLESVNMAAKPLGGSFEVIVADNASTDQTAVLAQSHGARVVKVPVRGIAAARNGGARVAMGRLLAFVDADSIVHPRSLEAVLQAMDCPRCLGGATGATVSKWSVPLRLLQGMTTPLRWMGIDTGLVFCRREDFQALGGYDESLLVGEDVDFLFRLRRQGRSSGRRLKRLSGVEVITSTRKFDKHGHWGFLGAMARAALLKPLSPARFQALVKRYWYEDR